ncbi:MAG: ABC transporter permease [Acidobacteriota bacterium]|nr:ABC transporter permease [Acidobacteriota bacterium]MDH3784751.1 ABC transporter permease [Acidobacteriota bacterium]
MRSAVWLICRQEFTLNRRNRWVLSFALLFAVLTLVLAYFGMVTSGYAGFQDFTRTAASIVNLGGFLIPLFAMLLGVFSFITNHGYFEILITQPVPRWKVLLGRYLGLLLTIVGASLLGFGLPGAVIALAIGVAGAQSYLAVVAYSILLAMVFTGLSVLISLIAQRRQIALGLALGTWVFFELVYGMLMLGTTLYLSPAVLKTVLPLGLMGNPVDIVRVLSLLQVGGDHLYGPAGATLMKLTGSSVATTGIGLLGLLVWVVVPLVLSMRILSRQNL